MLPTCPHAQHQMKRLQRPTRLLRLLSPCVSPKRPKPTPRAPGPTGSANGKRQPTSSLDAYDYFLRAQAAHFQFTRDATDQAVGLYEQAIALDPQFAPAYAALAAALNQRKTWEWSADPAADASQAIAYAKTALRLGSQDALILARSPL